MKSASKIGSSTSFKEACTVRSAAVGMPSRRSFPLALGIIFSRTGCGENRPSLEVISQPAEQLPGTEDDGARSHSIDTGRACPLVAPDPTPRHDEERRVIDEVVEVIETTIRVS